MTVLEGVYHRVPGPTDVWNTNPDGLCKQTDRRRTGGQIVRIGFGSLQTSRVCKNIATVGHVGPRR